MKLVIWFIPDELAKRSEGDINFAGVRDEVDKIPAFACTAAKIFPKLSGQLRIRIFGSHATEQFYRLSFNDQDFIALGHSVELRPICVSIPRAPNCNGSRPEYLV